MPPVLTQVTAAARAFFNLPMARKRRCMSRARAPRGYSAVHSEAFSILEGRRGPNDCVEKMRMGPPNLNPHPHPHPNPNLNPHPHLNPHPNSNPDSPDTDPASSLSPLLAPTPWGEQGDEEVQLRTAMTELYGAMESVAATKGRGRKP